MKRLALLFAFLLLMPSWALAGTAVTERAAGSADSLSGLTFVRGGADALIKTGPGFVHTLTCSSTDAAATAGTIKLYDNTAESGTVIVNLNPQAVYYAPFTITLDVQFTTGLYIGYTTTNDMDCGVTYR